MFPRVLICKILPSAFQVAKVTAAQYSKPLSRNFTSHHVSPLTITHVIPRRSYSEQVQPEAMIVNYEQVKKAASDGNILIIDVREPDEIKEHGKIPNSINIPLGNVTSTLSSLPETEFKRTYQRSKPTEDTEIIFYCMIGKRSGMAQQNAINLGFKNVKNYLGSWTDWATKAQAK